MELFTSRCMLFQLQCCLFLVAPGLPTLTVANHDDLYEGYNTTLQCSSAGGNPTPAIHWSRNGQRIVGATVLPPSERFGTTVSVLQWQLSRSDNGATFRCDVENEASEQVASDSHTLNVMCKYKLRHLIHTCSRTCIRHASNSGCNQTHCRKLVSF